MASTVPDGNYPPVTATQSSALFSPPSEKQNELSGPGTTTPVAGADDPQHSPQKSAATAPSSSSTRSATSPDAKSTGLRPDMYSFVVSGTTFQIDLKYKFLKPIGHGAYGVVM